MTIINNSLPEITFARRKVDSEAYTVPKDVETSWWYVIEEPADDDEEFPFEGHKEGVCLSIRTKNNDYSLTLSTETLVDMLRTVAQRITGSDSISLALAEAPDRGLRRRE